MGNIDNSYVMSEAHGMKFPDGVYVVAESSALSALDTADTSDQAPMSINAVAITLDEAIPDEVIRRAMIVVVQADPASPRSMQRIGELRAARPFMPLIVALGNSNVALVRSLIRQGVNDVVALPFDRDQLSGALFDAAAGAEVRSQADVVPAPLIAVLGSIGGCGTTTIATHLAAELALQEGGCCLLDLDVQFGTVASFLGVAGRSTVSDLLGAQARLDADLLAAVSINRGNGLQVVVAPESIMPLEDVDSDQLMRVIGLTRRNFGAVVIDLPSNFTNWSLSTLLNSSMVLLVVELHIASLRQAKRQLDLLADIGFDRKKVGIVVNRVERRLFKTINLGDVETALGVSALTTVSSEPALLRSAQDQGLLSHELEKRNRLSSDIAKLAGLLDPSAFEE